MFEPAFDHNTPQAAHSYITPPSSASPPNRPSFATRFFGRSFRTANKRNSQDLSPVLSLNTFPDTPKTSTSTSPCSTAAEFYAKNSKTSKYRISSPMPLVQAKPNSPELSKRDSISSQFSIRPSIQAKSNGQAVPRMRRKKSVGNWLDVAKRKSGLWWESIAEKESTVTAPAVEQSKYQHQEKQETEAEKEETSSSSDASSLAEERKTTFVGREAPKLPELQQMGIRINGGKTGLTKVIGDIGR